MFALIVGLVLSAAPEVPKPKDMGGFVSTISMNGQLAVMDGTEVIFDGKRTPWHEVPDENTEIVELHIDMKRKMILLIVYKTRRDI